MEWADRDDFQFNIRQHKRPDKSGFGACGEVVLEHSMEEPVTGPRLDHQDAIRSRIQKPKVIPGYDAFFPKKQPGSVMVEKKVSAFLHSEEEADPAKESKTSSAKQVDSGNRLIRIGRWPQSHYQDSQAAKQK